MNDHSENLTLIKDCEMRESRLLDWERGFIDSLQHQLGKGLKRLSPDQERVLEEIWERATARG